MNGVRPSSRSPAGRDSGVTRTAAAFASATDQDRAAMIVFLAAGDPDYATTVALAQAAAAAGADIIELGAPFSDPLADGPVIQAAYTRALVAGATTPATLACAREVAATTGVPVVLMVAFNCVLAYGVQRFCRDASESGVSGLLVPDLPVEDAGALREAASAVGLGTVFLVGPDSTADRITAAAGASTGFVYLVRRRGITGAGAADGELGRRIAEVRAAASVPVAVGFGIATAADAAEVAALADGVIVGSALVEIAHAQRPAAEAVGQAVAKLVTGLGRANQPRTERRPAATGGRE